MPGLDFSKSLRSIYTKAEINLICSVVYINSPDKLVDYNQLCLARELEYWWKLHKKNYFDLNGVDSNLEFCKGIVNSWYIRAIDYCK